MMNRQENRTKESKESNSSESICRKTLGITIRRDLLQKAREQGLNLGKVMENSLVALLSARTPLNEQTALETNKITDKMRAGSSVGMNA